MFRRVPYVMESRMNAERAAAYLRNFVEGTRDIFFVQFGANDGTDDPIFDSVKKYGWKGLLIEPLAPAFTKLKKNYQGSDGLIFENCAVSDKNEKRICYYLSGRDRSGSEHNRRATLSREYAEMYCDMVETDTANLNQELVPCLTVPALFHKHNIEKVDLLVVDVEGLDFEVLKQFDFDRYKPKVVLCEEINLPGRKRNLCQKFLRAQGYTVLHYWGDLLAYLPETN